MKNNQNNNLFWKPSPKTSRVSVFTTSRTHNTLVNLQLALLTILSMSFTTLAQLTFGSTVPNAPMRVALTTNNMMAENHSTTINSIWSSTSSSEPVNLKEKSTKILSTSVVLKLTSRPSQKLFRKMEKFSLNLNSTVLSVLHSHKWQHTTKTQFSITL